MHLCSNLKPQKCGFFFEEIKCLPAQRRQTDKFKMNTNPKITLDVDRVKFNSDREKGDVIYACDVCIHPLDEFDHFLKCEKCGKEWNFSTIN